MNDQEKFDKFFALVQAKASEQGKVFFMDTGEGHEEDLGDMIAENLSGWLINKDNKKEFESAWKSGTETSDKFNKNYVFAIWNKLGDGELIITFRHYQFFQ